MNQHQNFLSLLLDFGNEDNVVPYLNVADSNLISDTTDGDKFNPTQKNILIFRPRKVNRSTRNISNPYIYWVNGEF